MEEIRKYRFEPDYAVAPGETITEVCESLNMTKKELAMRLELTEQTINRIINGTQPVSYATANKLELVTGIAAKFWNNLEANYREQLAKKQEREQLSKDISWLIKLPVKELVKRGFVKNSPSNIELLRNVLQFFGVSSVKAWEKVWEVPQIATRRSQCFETKPEIASAWIRCGEIMAEDIKCDKYNRKSFLDALNDVRKLTVLELEKSREGAIELCRRAGVALALVPQMEKVPWNGASKWISSNKALIILSSRGKTEDKYWFSFFHEAAHILQDSKKGLYIADISNDPLELSADKFAADFLIPEKYNKEIESFSRDEEFVVLAEELGISAGIVAGRYQYITKNWNKFRHLIRS
jgi:addiction module HigA family antidote